MGADGHYLVNMIEITLDELEVRIDGEAPVFFLGGRPFSGRVKEVRSNRLSSTFVVSDGYKSGLEVIYSDTGSIEARHNFLVGLLHGCVENFYANGGLEDRSEFELGVCVRSISYDKAGAEIDRAAVAAGQGEGVGAFRGGDAFDTAGRQGVGAAAQGQRVRAGAQIDGRQSMGVALPGDPLRLLFVHFQ